MPDIEITDQLDKPIEKVQVDLSNPSSLVKYLKTELLHLAVLPDFLERSDSTLSQAATKPICFEAKAQHEFQLGDTTPEINATPGARATIRVNATPGSNLFDGDPFHAAAKVPAGTGYVSAGFEGSLDLGVSGSDGDLTFGFDKTTTVALEYLKAFPLGAGEPTLGNALAQTLSSYVIPAEFSDLAALGVNDIATASGQGSLKVSGGVKITASPNPLASVDLPLNIGTAAVKAGATTGVSASFTLSGAYQIRARRMDADTIEVSFLQKSGTDLEVTFSGSVGVTAGVGSTDLIAALLGAISTDPASDKELLADLRPVEVKSLSEAIKSCASHSLQASLAVVLSALSDDEAAFQYEIHPSKLSQPATSAIRRALAGDLTQLTAMEGTMSKDGVLAPGLTMKSSVFSEMRKRGCALKINLLGILNYASVAELIRNSEVISDTTTGDLTIKETVTGNSIVAITEPLARNEAMRKAIFNSVLITTTYRAGKAVKLPELSSSQVHFAINQNTNQQIMGDYLRWFVALNLLTGAERTGILEGFIDGGASTCILRTLFQDSDCKTMFLDQSGQPFSQPHYLELGRLALRALLDPQHQAIDALRYQIVDDALWPTALERGACSALGELVGLSADDPHVEYLIGDVMVITDWAEAMAGTGALVQDMRAFVGDADPATFAKNPEFKKKCDGLQKKLSQVVGKSKTRFDEPWGMVCLFWAAGSPQSAYAKTSALGLVVERGMPSAIAAAAAETS